MPQRFPPLNAEQWVRLGQSTRAALAADHPITATGYTRMAIEIYQADGTPEGFAAPPKSNRQMLNDAFRLGIPDDAA